MKIKAVCLILSLMLVIALIPQISFASENSGGETGDAGVITGFVPMETSEYYYEGNPDEGDLTLNLPETLNVYLNGSDQATAINVTWETVEDFNDTDFYFYSMKPVWGNEYTLSSELSEILDVPWITVYKQEPENDEFEPVVTEEEAEPIYTEEEGPIDPEASGAADIVQDTAKAVVNSFAEESYAADTNNADAIYAYLTGTMGLNTAAACGVMTNIYAESAMISNNLQNSYSKSFGLSDDKYTELVDKSSTGAYKTSGGTSKNFKTDSAGYGLCQWTSSGRKGNLLSAVKEADKSVSDLQTQMAYLNTELNSYSQVLTTLQKVPNTAAGAYIAAAEFCLSFEIPANTVATAASRGKTCLANYWKTYSGTSASVSGTSFVSLCGYTYPTSVKTGKGMDVSGYAVSNYDIKSVTGKITNSSGKTVYSKTLSANTTSCKLSGLDSYMKFAKLGSGTYTYTLSAKDSLGKTVTASHTFTVSSGVSTVKVRGYAINDDGSTPGNTTPDTIVKKAYTGTWPKLPSRGYFKKGDKGTQVKNLQKFLKWYGYDITTGGKYGPSTVSAVKKFQKAMNLKRDGKFGKKTLAKAKTIKK